MGDRGLTAVRVLVAVPLGVGRDLCARPAQSDPRPVRQRRGALQHGRRCGPLSPHTLQLQHFDCQAPLSPWACARSLEHLPCTAPGALRTKHVRAHIPSSRPSAKAKPRRTGRTAPPDSSLLCMRARRHATDHALAQRCIVTGACMSQYTGGTRLFRSERGRPPDPASRPPRIVHRAEQGLHWL